MEEKKSILIVCGEPSGDMQAAALVRHIKTLAPGLRVEAVGGTFLRDAGAEIFYDIGGLSVMGLFDVIVKLPRFLRLKKAVLQRIRERTYSAVIFVDFSGFNLRLAKAINNAIKTVYYISPQVWASRAGRIKTIKKYIRHMVVLFRFEQEFYQLHGIRADWVGHPLLDIVRAETDKKTMLTAAGLKPEARTIALLPGSRPAEIRRIFPVMVAAAHGIAQQIPGVQFLVAKPVFLDETMYAETLDGAGLNVKIVEGKAYDCINAADFCLVCSGTATLETAILGKPFVIVYKTAALNYFLYKPQVKVPYIGMVNIVAGRKIIPEFIQYEADPQAIAELTVQLLNDPAQLRRMRENLATIKSQLGETGAASRAAQVIIHSISKQ